MIGHASFFAHVHAADVIGMLVVGIAITLVVLARRASGGKE